MRVAIRGENVTHPMHMKVLVSLKCYTPFLMKDGKWKCHTPLLMKGEGWKCHTPHPHDAFKVCWVGRWKCYTPYHHEITRCVILSPPIPFYILEGWGVWHSQLLSQLVWNLCTYTSQSHPPMSVRLFHEGWDGFRTPHPPFQGLGCGVKVLKLCHTLMKETHSWGGSGNWKYDAFTRLGVGSEGVNVSQFHPPWVSMSVGVTS